VKIFILTLLSLLFCFNSYATAGDNNSSNTSSPKSLEKAFEAYKKLMEMSNECIIANENEKKNCCSAGKAILKKEIKKTEKEKKLENKKIVKQIQDAIAELSKDKTGNQDKIKELNKMLVEANYLASSKKLREQKKEAKKKDK
jgi:hypothetical protein